VRCVGASITRDGSGDIPAALTCFSLNVAYMTCGIYHSLFAATETFFSVLTCKQVD
jgi:hypothetical protein